MLLAWMRDGGATFPGGVVVDVVTEIWEQMPLEEPQHLHQTKEYVCLMNFKNNWIPH